MSTIGLTNKNSSRQVEPEIHDELYQGLVAGTKDINTGVLTATTVNASTAFSGTTLKSSTATDNAWPLAFDKKDYVEFFEDFLLTASSVTTTESGKFDVAADIGEWFVTEVDGATGQTETVLGVPANDGLGGWGTFTTCNADNDKLSAQMNGSSFKLATGKKLWYEARFAIADVSAVEFFIGLAPDGTTDGYGTSGAGVNDHVGFFNDADGNIDCSVDQDGTQTKADTTANLVDGTVSGAVAGTADHAHKFGFYWDGAGVIKFYVDGVLTNTVTDNGTTVVIPDDEVLSPVFTQLTNTTASATTYIDYIHIIQER